MLGISKNPKAPDWSVVAQRLRTAQKKAAKERKEADQKAEKVGVRSKIASTRRSTRFAMAVIGILSVGAVSVVGGKLVVDRFAKPTRHASMTVTEIFSSPNGLQELLKTDAWVTPDGSQHMTPQQLQKALEEIQRQIGYARFQGKEPDNRLNQIQTYLGRQQDTNDARIENREKYEQNSDLIEMPKTSVDNLNEIDGG